MRPSSMSIVDILLEELSKTELNYKGVRVNMFGLPILRRYKKQSVTNAIYRLQKSKYVQKTGQSIQISSKGKEYLKNKKSNLKIFDKNGSKDSKNKILFLFDIPEYKRGERQWLRIHLKKFGFKMVQQSVWLGPASLPKEFLDYLKEIKLSQCIKMYKVTKS